ncbi:MAG TPA: LamG-like jellyroll fold domain-containing protein [Nocardioidaceae bacterium]|nr:LamG-like jellyroll fold domain-containing protein [Nocardioidaceae bacterium]
MIETGVDFGLDGEGNQVTGYTWPRRPPAVPPVEPYRIIQVPDHNELDLNVASETYTVELRYKTREKFGNIVQKGQAQARGGQFKIQNPQGRPSCLFNGSLGRGATRAKVALNDNEWHVLTCVRSETKVEMFVDGVFQNRKVGRTGTINNKVPVTIGGKINCDQVETTCDYFSGDIDYVKMSIG